MNKQRSTGANKLLNLFKISFVCAGLLLATQAKAQSSSCNRAWDNAKDAGSEASSAFRSDNWSRAADLYQRAASKWEEAASECSGKNKDTARSNAETSRNNLSAAQNNLNKEKCKPYVEPATNLFQEGQQLFAAREWRRAADIYLKAEQQYQKAVQNCDGQSVNTARNNSEIASGNRQKALNNIDIDSKNANIRATNEKKAECRAIRESITTANASGKSTEEEKKYKEAVEFYISVENDVKKIEKICKDIYSESSMADFAKTAADAKSRKETLFSKIKYENECNVPGEKFHTNLSEIIIASDTKQKYTAAVNNLDKQLKVLEKNCSLAEDKEIFATLRKEFPLFKNEQKCFQKLASIEKVSADGKDKFMGEVKGLCKSLISETFVIKAEESFNAPAEKEISTK
jgi:tetratricopeptide (TPR) repeat protein